MFSLFFSLIYGQLFAYGDNILADLSYVVGGETSDTPVLSFDVYISELMALVCTIVVYVLCCLFVYKMVKLIGRLFVRL